MRSGQIDLTETAGWHGRGGEVDGADLVLYFGTRQTLADGDRYRELRDLFPRAHVMGCSTGGQIAGDEVTDDGVSAVAMRFDGTPIRAHREALAGATASRACGEAIGRALATPDLAGVFVLSDGLNVNGSKLVAGINAVIGRDVPVTGGLAGQAGAGLADGGVAVLVSCIGRRLLMGQRTVDEVEAAGIELGRGTPRIGFYSYGEISPHAASGVCELHNQTMTVTTIAEARSS